METERIVSALHEIHQGHGKTLEEFRSTIAQLKKTISDAVQLREIQVRCEAAHLRCQGACYVCSEQQYSFTKRILWDQKSI
jgi:hypothetical protein